MHLPPSSHPVGNFLTFAPAIAHDRAPQRSACVHTSTYNRFAFVDLPWNDDHVLYRASLPPHPAPIATIARNPLAQELQAVLGMVIIAFASVLPRTPREGGAHAWMATNRVQPASFRAASAPFPRPLRCARCPALRLASRQYTGVRCALTLRGRLLPLSRFYVPISLAHRASPQLVRPYIHPRTRSAGADGTQRAGRMRARVST
ncbi:hypothetical protein HYPSUDRAFT_206346 [Hypholoma sublateritium FD-334 SS-4]|uniref:Uncharacterized protein n=1 Tax=Hypholoma sublateritium (strain FD-334 SS-4) TaxID=945553 RepID=A0A0D2NL32_HYPSF|nr:hypothetical protein HYPSUDRAFT_206346 [Hypholoma sublateritium FD-334 SS-4]